MQDAFPTKAKLKLSPCLTYLHSLLPSCWKNVQSNLLIEINVWKKDICPLDSGLEHIMENTSFHKLCSKCSYSGEISLQIITYCLGIIFGEISRVTEKLSHTVKKKFPILYIATLLKLNSFPC